MVFFLGFIAARLAGNKPALPPPEVVDLEAPADDAIGGERSEGAERSQLIDLLGGEDLVPANDEKEDKGDKDDTKEARALRRNDPVAAYLAQARRIPLLTREEEHDLAVKHRDHGDVAAARTLVTANLRLVVKIANEYKRAYPALIDLVGEGNIGLMQAVAKYDPDRGARFSTYAAWWIRAYILKFILDNWRIVRIGTTQAQRKLFFRLKKEKEALTQQGIAPEPKVLAARMAVTEDEVAEMEQRLAPETSLDAPASRDEPDGASQGDLMPAPREDRPDAQVEDREFQTALRTRLDTFGRKLRGREKSIFESRWLTADPLTLQEVGDKFGISRERTRQIEKRLLDRLRAYLESELGSAVNISRAA